MNKIFFLQDFLVVQKKKDSDVYKIGAFSNISLSGNGYFMQVAALSGKFRPKDL